MNVKAEICTPPASSPECPPISPAYGGTRAPRCSQVPDALGLYGYSDPRATQAGLLCPATPPSNEAWTTQAESLTATTLSLEAQIVQWPSATFDECQALSASHWEASLGYASGNAFADEMQATTAGYSPFHLQATHGVSSQQVSACSSYDGYGSTSSTARIGSPFQTGPNPYFMNHSMQPSFHPDVFDPQHSAIASPQSEGVHLSTVTSSGSLPTILSGSGDDEGMDELKGLRSTSVPGGTEFGDDLLMAPVARVRRRRRRTSASDSVLITCSHCGHGFDRTYNYKEHLKTHNPTRDRPFPCTVEGCTQRPFTRIHDLDRHMKAKHLKSKDHECGYCYRRFGRKDTLRRHMEDGCQLRKQVKGSPAGLRAKSEVEIRPATATPPLINPELDGQTGPLAVLALPPMKREDRSPLRT